MQTTLSEWLKNNEGDDKKEFNSRQKALYEQQKRELRNARIALIKTGLKAEEVNAETLPGNIVAKTEGKLITVDPVIFRDLTFAEHVLEHEKAHKQGITNEALAEILAGLKAKDNAVPEYIEAINNMKKITDIVGLKNTIELYQQENYTALFRIFVQKSINIKSYSACKREFEKAFPELEILSMKN